MSTDCVLPFSQNILTFYWFELIFEVIALLNSFLFLLPLIKASTIHIHLRISILTMCGATLFRGIVRITAICDILCCFTILTVSQRNIFIYLFGAGNVSIMMIEVTIIAERTLSHIMTKKYESFRSLWVVFFISVAPVLVAFIVTLNTVYLKTIPLMPSNWTMMSFIFVSWILFFTVLKYHNYREKRTQQSKTLSERYQQAENLRTNRTIIWWCVFCFIHRLLSGGVQIYKGIGLLHTSGRELADITALTDSLLHLSYGIMMNFFPLVFIITLPALQKKYRELYPFINRCYPPKRIEPGFVVTSQGKEVKQIQTISGHFNDLVNTWDTRFDNKKSGSIIYV